MSSKMKLTFKDGEKSVDYILAYDTFKEDTNHIRKAFEENLIKEGLEIEMENSQQQINFVKIHAPMEVLARYCQLLKLKLPLKVSKEGCHLSKFERKLLDKEILCEFTSQRKDLFNCENLGNFTHRIEIVNFILERQRFDNENHGSQNYGIQNLIKEGVYEDAYPLHDGRIDQKGCARHTLLIEWATIKKMFRHQPLNKIREYFGTKIALYFAWLEFYTIMLIPPSILGIIAVIYAFYTFSNDPISKSICNDRKSMMCPRCNGCDYLRLRHICLESIFNYWIDNNFTVFYALFMSIWAVLYLEFWKRYSARLIHEWGLTNFTLQVEQARPQYLEKLKNVKSQRFNAFANIYEPRPSFWRILPSFVFSYSIILLFISLTLVILMSLIVYRMSVKSSKNILFENLPEPLAAGTIDIIVIKFLDYIYTNHLVVFLTNIEYRRTETEYQESLSFKNYLFQFCNYYSSLFYIAIFKGKLVGYPNQYNKIFGIRQEECNPGGCLMELCVQLIIILIGKRIQIWDRLSAIWTNIMEILDRRNTVSKEEKKLIPKNQWTEDFLLMPWTHYSLYSEYLEMVIQFGFITIFGLAFPLAPLCALINNAFELRTDAKKILKHHKRPNPQRANTIGVWLPIMTVLTKVAVASTSIIIAFSSNLIPKLVYITEENNKDYNFTNYLDWTLSSFDTSDLESPPEDSHYIGIKTCKYTDFLQSPHKRPLLYWKTLAFRLIFLVVFQNLVGMIQTIVAWAIPDTPRKLNDQIKQEKLLIHDTLLEFERKNVLRQVSNDISLTSENLNTIFHDHQSNDIQISPV